MNGNHAGKTFYFPGDWQTEPGAWTIVREQPEPHAFVCVPADTNNLPGESTFWPDVVDRCLKDAA